MTSGLFGALGGIALTFIVAGAGLVWLRASLEAARTQGLQAGRLQAQAEARVQFDAARAQSEAALARANREAAQLTEQQIQLRSQVDALAQAIAKSSGHDRICLDGDVLRALADIGASSGVDRPGA